MLLGVIEISVVFTGYNIITIVYSEDCPPSFNSNLLFLNHAVSTFTHVCSNALFSDYL